MTRAADLPDLLLARAEAAEREVAAWRAAAAGEVRADMQADATLVAALEERTREVAALRRHYDAAGPEHNLLALLDLYEERRLSAEREVARLTAERERALAQRDGAHALLDLERAEVRRLTADGVRKTLLLGIAEARADRAESQLALAMAWGATACADAEVCMGLARVAGRVQDHHAARADAAEAALATAGDEGAVEIGALASRFLEALSDFDDVRDWSPDAAEYAPAEEAYDAAREALRDAIAALPLRGTR
jgi:hypothetical protein